MENAGESKDAEARLKSARRYVKRLDRARLEIDARLAVLSRQQGQVSWRFQRNLANPSKAPVTSETERNASIISDISSSVNLYVVLADPSSLAYWLEFMDRRGRSRLVQFWLTIEGFKDPLEAAGQDSVLDHTVEVLDTPVSTGNESTILEDVAFLTEAYFSRPDVSIDVPLKHLAVMKEFSQSSSHSLSTLDARRLRHAIFASQKAVYEQMAEDDWVDFRKSELFLKVITDLSRNTIAPKIHIKRPSSVVPLPPIQRQRQRTAPPGLVRDNSELRSPGLRPLPYLVNGSFTPAIATPSASVSYNPPTFDRTITETKVGFRKASAEDADTSASLSSLPTTPPPIPRRSSHLDYLISGEMQQKGPDRDRLFQEEADTAGEEDEDDVLQSQRMEAIQAALNDIIASDADNRNHMEAPLSPVPQPSTSSSASTAFAYPRDDRFGTPSKLVSRSVEDLRNVNMLGKTSASTRQSRMPLSSNGSPRLSQRASLSKISLSADRSSNLFDDEHVYEDDTGSGKDLPVGPEIVQLAADGDLQLSVEIARLQDKTLELIKQEHLLETLIRQAELTGSETKLRILRRSQISVRREQRTAIFQKAQYEERKEVNRLVPGRTSVRIPSSVITTEDVDGRRQIVRYAIEVKIAGEDGQRLVGWMVARRYNEFWELDRAIRDQSISNPRMSQNLSLVAELPSKKLVPNLSSGFIESRRIGLERYLQVWPKNILCSEAEGLQSLTSSAVLSDIPAVRSFLSRSPVSIRGGVSEITTSSSAARTSLAPHNIVKSLYKTMATSLDEALLGPTMLDLMYTNLSRQLNDVAEGIGASELAGLGGNLLTHAFKGNAVLPTPSPSSAKMHTMQSLGAEPEIGSFTAPICDFFIELFDLKENNWLRRQAIVVILQQFLGGTIER